MAQRLTETDLLIFDYLKGWAPDKPTNWQDFYAGLALEQKELPGLAQALAAVEDHIRYEFGLLPRR